MTPMKPVVIMRFFTLHKPSTYRSAKMMFNTRSGKNFKILKWLLPHLCPVSVPKGGGGCGVYSESPRTGLFGTPKSACCTDDMSEILVCFGHCLCCLLPVFVNRQLPCPHENSLHGLLPPPMHRKSLWCAKGLTLGEHKSPKDSSRMHCASSMGGWLHSMETAYALPWPATTAINAQVNLL